MKLKLPLYGTVQIDYPGVVPYTRPVRRPVFPHAAFDMVILSGSLGAHEALKLLLPSIPELPVPIVVLTHMPGGLKSMLSVWLRNYTALEVRQAALRERLRANTIYVAPPARHLAVAPDGTLRFDFGPPVNFVRPSADVLLASAARRFGERALGVILSGMLHDGAKGAAAVAAAGGVIIAQDPAKCVAPGMPRAAIACNAAKLVMPPGAIADAIKSLVCVPGFLAVLGLGRRPAA